MVLLSHFALADAQRTPHSHPGRRKPLRCRRRCRARPATSTPSSRRRRSGSGSKTSSWKGTDQRPAPAPELPPLNLPAQRPAHRGPTPSLRPAAPRRRRRMLKERQKEDSMYGDKEKFVTAAYKKKLEEARRGSPRPPSPGQRPLPVARGRLRGWIFERAALERGLAEAFSVAGRGPTLTRVAAPSPSLPFPCAGRKVARGGEAPRGDRGGERRDEAGRPERVLLQPAQPQRGVRVRLAFSFFGRRCVHFSPQANGRGTCVNIGCAAPIRGSQGESRACSRNCSSGCGGGGSGPARGD